MLSYRDHDWLLRHGPSRFEVYIAAHHRQPKDVMWSLELHYVAAGARWRRVRQHERPQVQLSLSSWHLHGKWTQLAEIAYWDPDEVESEHPDMPLFLSWPGGWLDLYYKDGPGQDHEITTGLCAHWQVREREGAHFLVELAADPDGLRRMPPAEKKELVLADGQEEKDGGEERDLSDFWKKNAAIYALEMVPFGQVTVRVPRNATNAVAYAQRRVQELLGLSKAPEAYNVSDFLKKNSEEDVAEEWDEEDEVDEVDEGVAANSMNDDVYVKLHYHGYHEDE